MEPLIQRYFLFLWDQDRQQLPGFLSDRAATIKRLVVRDMYCMVIIRIKQHLLYPFFSSQEKLCIYFPVKYYVTVWFIAVNSFPFIKDNKHYLYTSERKEWKYPFSANLEAEYTA